MPFFPLGLTTGGPYQPLLTPGNSITIVGSVIDTIQDIRTTATPQFARLGLGVAASSSHVGLFNGDTISGAQDWVGDSILFQGGLNPGGFGVQRGGGEARFVALGVGAQSQLIGARANGSISTLIAPTGGAVGVLDVYGSTYTGSGWSYPVLMTFLTTETHSATNQGTQIQFKTTLTGGTSFDERGRFSGGGNFIVGGGADVTGPGRIAALGINVGAQTETWPFEVNAAAGGQTSNSGNATEFHIKNTSTGGREWLLLSWGAAAAGGAYVGRFSIFDPAGGDRLLIDTSGNVLIGGSGVAGAKLDVVGDFRTSSPSGGTAQPWKLGNYTAGAAAQVGKVRVEINGTPYDLLTA